MKYHFRPGKALRNEINGVIEGKANVLVEEKDDVPVNITLFNPHLYQLHILSEIESNPAKFFTVVCCRRFGKSILSQNLCLKWALNEPNQHIGYLISGLRLARTFFENICNSFPQELQDIIIQDINKTDLIIKFKNGSKLQFFSFENSEKLRGFTLTKAVIDESELLNDKDFYAAIYPIFANNLCKKVLLLGTPLSANGFFYDFYKKGLSKAEANKRYVSFHYDINHIPEFLMSNEEKKGIKKINPRPIYDMEWKAIFSNSNISVFGDYMKCVVRKESIPYDEKKTYYGGLDVAKQTDYMVFTVMDNEGNMVYQYREQREKYHSMAKRILNIIEKYHIIHSYIEINNAGDAMLEILQKEEKDKLKFHKWHEIYTSNESKQTYIEDLILAFQEQEIKILNLDALKTELSNFVLKISEKAKVRVYQALRGHDDTVISLALAWKAKQDFVKKQTQTYAFVIKR